MVICHLSFVLCPLSFVLCPLRQAQGRLCHLSPLSHLPPPFKGGLGGLSFVLCPPGGVSKLGGQSENCPRNPVSPPRDKGQIARDKSQYRNIYKIFTLKY